MGAFSANLQIEKCHYVQFNIILKKNHAIVSGKNGYTKNTGEHQQRSLAFL